MTKAQILATLFTIASIAEASNLHHRDLVKRQSGTSASASKTGTPTQAQTGAPVATQAPPPPANPNDPLNALTATFPGVPPLSQFTLGMPTGTPWSASTTYTAGAKPTFSGAPALPEPFVFNPVSWPEQDKVPPITSPEVKEWLKELDGWNIPVIPKNVDNTCASNPQAAKDAAKNGWWTCGAHVRPADIVACPDKMTWGVSFDDGPSDYTPKLLKYLDEKKIQSTFFVVGSRAISRPDILRQEYMSGHEISVHTWSHHALTTLSNEEIVAELGWTRKAIKSVTGVTPLTMRPPYGDIDDRVRAISMAMGLIPIMWTTAPSGENFDTNDWSVPTSATGVQQFKTFTGILDKAGTLNTGFIVLAHDLFPATVDLAVGYTLDAALQKNFKLEPVGRCSKIPTNNLYLESNANATFPFKNSTSGQSDANPAKGNTAGSNGAASSISSSSIFASYLVAAVAAAAALL